MATWLLAGVLVAVALFSLLLLYVLFAPSGTQTVQQPQAEAPAPKAEAKSTTVIASAKKWSKYLVPVVGAIVAIGVVVFVARSFGGVTLPDLPSANTLLFPAAVLVLLTLAFLGANGKAGVAGSWSLGIVAILVIGFVIYRVGLIVVYGEKADRIVQIQQERNAKEVLTGRSSTQRQAIQPEVVTITVTNKEWSKPVRVMGHQCIRWWTDDLERDNLKVEIRGVNEDGWIAFREWRHQKTTGSINWNPGWNRFRATGDKNVKVHYTLQTPSSVCN